MKIAIADVNEQGLHETAQEVADIIGQANVITVPTDVSKFESVVQFREKIYDSWGEVSSSHHGQVSLAALCLLDFISLARDEDQPPSRLRSMKSMSIPWKWKLDRQVDRPPLGS